MTDAPEVVHLELVEPPSANRWWRKFRNRMVLSAAARAYKEAVWLLTGRYRRAAPASLEALFAGGPVCVSVTWIRSRRAGDLDKRLGVLLDALQGTVYASDAQIVELHAYRREADHVTRGQVVVEISRPAAAGQRTEGGPDA